MTPMSWLEGLIMSEKDHQEHLLELARGLACGNAEEIAAAQVLCLVGACLEKDCVLFVFGQLLEAARQEAAREQPGEAGQCP